jgi:NAD(P)H dehydrogenase (quinone)
MRHLVILAHPREGSFNRRIASTYIDTVTELGHEAVLRDLYAMRFDPVAADTEAITRTQSEPAADVRIEMDHVRAADVLVFVSPVWWIAPPAMMKGWLDRVLRPGFAYGYRPDRRIGGLLTGRSGLVFTSSGSTVQEFVDTGKMDAVRTMWDIGTVRFCDMTLLDHLHFGPVGSRSTPELIDGFLDQVRSTARRHFGGSRPLPACPSPPGC